MNPEKINILSRLTEVGKKVGHVVTGPHPLATHGDHEFHRKEEELEVLPPLNPYGTVVRGENTGPSWYDRRGYPHYSDETQEDLFDPDDAA